MFKECQLQIDQPRLQLQHWINKCRKLANKNCGKQIAECSTKQRLGSSAGPSLFDEHPQLSQQLFETHPATEVLINPFLEETLVLKLCVQCLKVPFVRIRARWQQTESVNGFKSTSGPPPGACYTVSCKQKRSAAQHRVITTAVVLGTALSKRPNG